MGKLPTFFYHKFMKINSFDDLKELFNFDPIELLDEVFKQSEVQDTMIEFNQDQLQEGKDVTGTELITKKAEFERSGFPYSLHTVSIKKDKGATYDKVTLYDTGKFYKTFKVKINKSSYEIIANFKATDGNILDNFDNFYHDNILGLDYEGLTELANEIIYPRLAQIINKRFGF